MKKNHFEGYYVKLQGKEETIICIPSIHYDKRGNATANLQVVCGEVRIEMKEKKFTYQKRKNKFGIKIGNNVFTDKGCKLFIEKEGIKIKGNFRYGTLTPIQYDIMGIFRFLPFLQCRHSIYSMYHTIEGIIICNQKVICIKNGMGYMEGDSGRDFPQKYFWTQAFLKQNESVMISVATVPLLRGLLPIKGCIAVLYYKGKEYRIATYLGAKIESIEKNKVVLRQRKKRLVAQILEQTPPKKLSAPSAGMMERTIEEKIKVKTKYTFYHNQTKLFETIVCQASTEQEWNIE